MSDVASFANPADSGRSGTSLPRRLWRLLSSVRLALALMLAVSALTLVGLLLPQAPPGALPSSPEYSAWLERARASYGSLADALDALQLFSVGSSLWMRLLLGLFAANALAATIRHLPDWRDSLRPSARASDLAFQEDGPRDEVEVASAVEAAERLRATLAGRGYRVLFEPGTTAYLHADRHRLSRLGVPLLHLGLVVLLAGALASSLWSFRDSRFVVPEGSTRLVSDAPSALALKVVSFETERYPDGRAKDYRSDVVLYEGRAEVARKTIHVNDPLFYGGYRIHEASFGPAFALRVQDPSGEVVFADAVPLLPTTSGSNVGYFIAAGGTLVGRLTQLPAAGGGSTSSQPAVQLDLIRDGAAIGGDVLAIGGAKPIGGLSCALGPELDYSWLQVVRDPGEPLVFGGGCLLLLGLGLVSALPYRRLRARFAPRPGGSVLVSLVSPGPGRLAASELRAAAGALRDEAASRDS